MRCLYAPPPLTKGEGGTYWFQYHSCWYRRPCRCRLPTSSVHDISWISGWNFTKFAWLYHWGKLKSLLDLVTLNSFSRSQEVKKMLKMPCPHSVAWRAWWILTNLHTYVIWRCKRRLDISVEDAKKKVIKFWWPWTYFQGHGRSKSVEKCLVFTLSLEGMDELNQTT